MMTRKKIILVADDDELTLSNIVELLLESGYKTVPANNGRIALEIIKKLSPDLIVSDVFMPELDGLGLLEELTKRNINIPVILLSAKANAEDIAVGLQKGAVDFLSKPFKSLELLYAIELNIL